MISSTETLISALRILARDIESQDGIANAAIYEAADRMEEIYGNLKCIFEHSKMKTRDVRKLIGKRVKWFSDIDHHRGTSICRYGVINDVKYRNVCIDGDWKWLPDLKGLQEDKADIPNDRNSN